ncbi:YybH family protein [Fulvivirga ligni]|uniref:YybH family protein n=1 Tax=Fulvivirga ligni TaxID=2904246 RepID=UPI001F4271A1|nr:nuclear transport factor 2 family protein [Fulvivirga ligni]UII23577.1 nuclear transport factor 2 family protein [Fulvivirga ligni]
MNNPQDFFTIYSKAAWNKDVGEMTALYHDDVIIFDMWNDAYSIGIEAWSEVIKDWLGSLGEERVKVIFEQVKVRGNESTAFASALIGFQAISKDDNVIRSMKNRVTVGFVYENGAWKVAHQHTSSPINSELKAILSF